MAGRAPIPMKSSAIIAMIADEVFKIFFPFFWS